MVSAPTPIKEPTLQERAAAARDGDIAIFSKAIHRLDVEPYQLAWEEALNTEDRIVISCPPDTYKSSTVQNWVERAIGLNHNIRILWLMNAGEQAEKRVMAVQQTIEQNRAYQIAFRVQPNKQAQWTKSVLYVKRDIESEDPTLMGCGLNGPYQGLHFDVVIIDDPTNQEDVRSPATMELQRSKIRGVVLDRLVEGGRFVVILTRWGSEDLVPTFKEMGFRIVVMPVIGDYPWGPTISNKRFPLARCEQIRSDKGDALFQLTYMGNPEALSGEAIHREHIRYWNTRDLPDNPLKIFIGVDPAASTKSYADPSAIVTVGLDVRTRRKYVLDVWAARVEVPQLEAEIVKRAKSMADVMAIGVETVAFQLSLVQYLKRHRNLPLKELQYRSRRQAMNKVSGIDKDKYSRALYLDQLFTTGMLFIPEKLPMFEGVSYESELVMVPFGKHDDRMDATVFACALADSAAPNKQRVKFSWS